MLAYPCMKGIVTYRDTSRDRHIYNQPTKFSKRCRCQKIRVNNKGFILLALLAYIRLFFLHKEPIMPQGFGWTTWGLDTRIQESWWRWNWTSSHNSCHICCIWSNYDVSPTYLATALIVALRTAPYHCHRCYALHLLRRECDSKSELAEEHVYKKVQCNINPYLGLSPFPVIVTARIISCLVGDSYKPSFATITGKGDNPIYTIYTMGYTPAMIIKVRFFEISVPIFEPYGFGIFEPITHFLSTKSQTFWESMFINFHFQCDLYDSFTGWLVFFSLLAHLKIRPVVRKKIRYQAGDFGVSGGVSIVICFPIHHNPWNSQPQPPVFIR